MTIGRITIIGAGTMGHGIAYVACAAGCRVELVDADPGALARATEKVAAAFDAGIARGKSTPEQKRDGLARLSVSTELADALPHADLVIEAVPERLELKKRVFANVDAHARPNAILATNTSSLPVSDIASAVHDPQRVIGMHFFNPVPVMKLVELVRGTKTSDATVAEARAFVERLGKTPIVVEDSPGFATSRLGVVLGLEAIRMLEAGVASAEDIDRAMELGYNHPVGPLRLSDIVGLDVRLAIADHLHEVLRADTYRAPELLRRMVAEGKLGKKTGEGFYRWDTP